jgi:predicted dithiol-disulfide oxidoreductase (DUF899 family)
MQPHKIVSRDEWLVACKAHLKNEKALTRMREPTSGNAANCCHSVDTRSASPDRPV